MIDETTFRNLNARGAWPGFELDGVVRDPDGALRLAAVPGRPEPVGPVLAPAPSLDGPAGAAVARDGTLFVTEPGLDRVLQVDPCDGSAGPMACLGGTGVAAGMLRRPRGIALGPRDLLYVADSGNHRVQVFEPSSGQVVEVWGPSGPDEEPEASADPGRFDDPWDVAADGVGFVYVVDHGNARVQRLDADGRPDLAYAAALAAWAEPPVGPRHVRVVRLDGEERVVIVDRPAAPAADRLLVHRTDGSLDEQRTDTWGDLRRRATGQAPAPVPAIAGLAVLGGELFLGDPDGGVLAFTVDGTFLGPARGFGGRPASLHWDGEGSILVHPGGGAVLTALTPEAARLESGTFVSGPIAVRDTAVRWQRVVALAPAPTDTEIGLASAGLRLSVATSDVPTPSVWTAGPANEPDVAVLGAPARYLWVAGVMFGDGEATPEVHQVRVEFERESWLRYLPPLYREDEAGRTFLERVLGLFESVEGDVSGLLDGLPRLLDAAGTPDDPHPGSWLDWLAGWVDARLDEAWPEERRRAMVAAAFELHALRGTPEGLRRLAELALDAPITVREPGAEATLWTLGEGSALGFGTMLVPAEAEGAVVGSTAIVDGSHLIEERDFGAPLFDDLAHRFCVQAYAADLSRPGAAEALSALLDREKPAHTEYHLCVVDARFRVGFQARIGVDSIVAGDPGPFVLGGEGELGFDSRAEGGRPAAVLDRDDRIGVLASMT